MVANSQFVATDGANYFADANWSPLDTSTDSDAGYTSDNSSWEHESSHFDFVENDTLQQQRELLNPWRTLSRFYPRPETYRLPGPIFPLRRLPLELIHRIAKFLPQESAACLAMTSRGMLTTLGTQVFKTDRSSRWKLLLLLEDEFHGAFACPVCLTIHAAPDHSSSPRWKCTSRGYYQSRQGLPASISYGQLKMLGRRILSEISDGGHRSRGDRRAYLQTLHALRMSIRHNTRHIKLVQHVVPATIGGNLLIQNQIMVHPFASGKLTYRSLAELLDRLRSNFRTKACGGAFDDNVVCSHHRWTESLEMTEIVDILDKIPVTKCKTDEDCDSLRTFRRPSSGFANHMAECYSNQVIDEEIILPLWLEELLNQDVVTEEPSIGNGVVSAPDGDVVNGGVSSPRFTRRHVQEFQNAAVNGCGQCFTDYSIGSCHVPGLGRCLVFTTWKDLGGVEFNEASKWNTHFEDSIGSMRSRFSHNSQRWAARSRRKVPRPLSREDRLPGGVYRTWIQKTSNEGQSRYFPTADPMMIRDLTRRTKNDRREPDEYWGSDHTTDEEAHTDESDSDHTTDDDFY